MDARVNKEVVPRTRTHAWRTASAALGVLTLVVLPAPSLARSAPQARFKATVEGAQTVTWKRDAVYVDDDYRKAQAADPFAHCPARAAEWPTLAAEDPSNINRLFSARLSTRRLFDRRVKKFDVRGRGSGARPADPNGLSYTVQVSWHVVLRRVR